MEKLSKNKKTKQASLKLEGFINFLRSEGYRYTKEREAIAKEVLSNLDHFDVDNLFARLQDNFEVSRASVYRTLPLLIKAGLIIEVYMEDGHMHYEPVCGHSYHCHLICQKCRKILEYPMPIDVKRLEEELIFAKNFISEGYKLDIWGLCEECQNQTEVE